MYPYPSPFRFLPRFCVWLFVLFGLFATEALAQRALPVIHRLAAAPGPAPARHVYYVDADAAVSGDGSADAPFRTIQEAHNRTLPNDVVYLRGTFRYSGGGELLIITRSGAPGYPITYTSWPGHRAVLKVDLTGEGRSRRAGWGCIRVRGASHIVIAGLTLRGANADPGMSLAFAESIYDEIAAGGTDWTYYSSTNTDGLVVERRRLSSNPDVWRYPVDVTIRDCDISLFAGGGIGVGHADYVTVEGNRVYDNSWYTVFGTSGIMVSQGHNSDSLTGYKHVVSNNVVHGNESRVRWVAIRDYSDGNGIICDLNTTGIANPGLSVGATYQARTLVIGNLSYNNGGSGLHSVTARGVDYIHNTAFHNSARHAFQGHYPELGALWQSAENRFYNNLVVSRPGGRGLVVMADSTGGEASHNAFHGAAPASPGANDFVGDPRLRGVPTDLRLAQPADFAPRLDSPLRERGLAWTGLGSPPDLSGTVRPFGARSDLGAIEHGADSPEHNLVANAALDDGLASWSTFGGTVPAVHEPGFGALRAPALRITAPVNFTSYLSSASVPGAPAGLYSAAVSVRGTGTWRWSGLLVQDGDTVLAFSTLRPSADWTRHTLHNIAVPAGADLHLVVWADADAGSEIHLDDFRLVNQLTHALGAPAGFPAEALAPAPALVGDRLGLRFARRDDPRLRYTVEASSELAVPASEWTPVWSSFGTQNLPGEITAEDTAPLPPAGGRFLRLRVELAP